jgi:hypothetical protein
VFVEAVDFKSNRITIDIVQYVKSESIHRSKKRKSHYWLSDEKR